MAFDPKGADNPQVRHQRGCVKEVNVLSSAGQEVDLRAEPAKEQNRVMVRNIARATGVVCVSSYYCSFAGSTRRPAGHIYVP